MLMTNRSLDANLQTLWRGTLIQQSATLRAPTEASHLGPNSMNWSGVVSNSPIVVVVVVEMNVI